MALDVRYKLLIVFALGIVAGVSVAGAQTPGVSHDWSEIILPSGVWTGLNADSVDGLDTTELCKSDGTNCPAGGGLDCVEVSGGRPYSGASNRLAQCAQDRIIVNGWCACFGVGSTVTSEVLNFDSGYFSCSCSGNHDNDRAHAICCK